MIHYSDLLQWDRFITPSVIRLFYWLAVALVAMSGLSFIFTALALMVVNFVAGFFMLLAALLFVLAGIIFVRILCELVMVAFRINEHLGAIRERRGM